MSNVALRRTGPLLLALLLVVLTLMTTTPPAHAAAAGILQDYEDDASVAATTVTLPDHDAVARVPFGSHGETGVEFTVAPRDTPGAGASSGLTLSQDTAAMPDNDWSGHTYLVWDFWMPADYTTTGRITIRDDHGVAWGMNYAIRGRGWTAVQVPLAEVARAGLDLTDIRYMGVSIPRRTEPVKGYFDAFRLVDGTPDNSEFGARVVQNLVEQVDFASSLDAVDAELAEIAALLGDEGTPSYATMKAQIDALVARSAEIRDGLGNISTVEQYNTMIKSLSTLLAAPARLEQIPSGAPRSATGDVRPRLRRLDESGVSEGPHLGRQWHQADNRNGPG